MSLPVPEEALIPGRGAWTATGKDNGSRYYCLLKGQPLDGSPATGTVHQTDLHHLAVWYGVKAIQYRLDYLGFRGRSGGRLSLDGIFGQKTKHAVRWFQDRENLPDDGVVGPATAMELWRPLVWAYGVENGGRPDLLWGQTMLESAFDPGAVSALYKEANGADFGLCQINLHFNPTVTMEAAFTPEVALMWSARRMASVLDEFSGKGDDLQELCTVAYHNSPVRAEEWYETGEPPTEQIATYARLVLARAATFVPPDE